MNCPFCNLDGPRAWLANGHAVALRDGYPVSEGHTLVIPKQHSPSLFDLPAEVQRAVWELAAEVRKLLVMEFNPDGFNVGINDGEAAGQTVPHAHVHVIPRYDGDVEDPRGGIRWVIPHRAIYWET
ncbi:MAG: HIT family protein [Planctomycetota bacterium]|nr:HIT family protein [Planctomycetota bacterium]